MEPSQEYTISFFKVGDFTDKNNNVWCEILFEEKSNEPMRIVVKDPSSYHVGQKLFGHVELKTSQAGKPYNRFYRDKRPDFEPQGHIGVGTGQPIGAFVPKKEWQPRDDKAIQAQWAIGQAVSMFNAESLKAEQSQTAIATIEVWAKRFFAMIDRVKAGQAASAPNQLSAPIKDYYSPPKQSPGSYQEDKNDAEFESMIQSGMYAEGIDPEEYNG